MIITKIPSEEIQQIISTYHKPLTFIAWISLCALLYKGITHPKSKPPIKLLCFVLTLGMGVIGYTYFAP